MPVDIDSLLTGFAGGFDPDPKNWGPIYQQATKQFGIPELVLRALVQHESAGHAGAVSGKGAEGPAQIMPENKGWLGIGNSFDPREAIPGAAKYLQQALKTTGGNWEEALKLYAGGPNKANWGPATNSYPTDFGRAYASLGGDPKVLGLGTPTGTAPEITVTAQKPAIPAAAPAGTATETAGGPPQLDSLDKIFDGMVGKPPLPNIPQVGSPQSPIPVPKPVQLDTAQPPLSPVGGQGQGQNPIWGPGRELMSSYLMGFGPEVMAGSQAAKGVFQGFPLSTAGKMYAQALTQYQGAQQAWADQNKLSSVALPILGAAIPTAMGIGGAERLLGAGAGAVARALPNATNLLRPAQSFLTGQGGNLLASLVGGGVRGAAEGAGAGALQSHMSNEPTSGQVETGGVVGGILGSMFGPVMRGVSAIANPIIQPAIAQLADLYHGMIGPEATKTAGLRPGQLTTNSLLKYLDKKNIAGSEQLPEFTRQLSKTVGGNTDELLRQDFAALRDRIGNGLDSVATRTGVNYTQRLASDLSDLERSAVGSLNAGLPNENEALVNVQRAVQDIEGKFVLSPNFKLTGQEYQDITKKSSFIGRMINSPNAIVREYGVKLKDALDLALEQSSPPGDVARLRELRQQWKNSVVLERLVDLAPSGVLNPQALGAQVKRIYSSFGWSSPTDIQNLADVGKLLPKADATGAAQSHGMLHRLFHQVEAGMIGGGVAGLAEGHFPWLSSGLAATGAGILGAHEGLQKLLTANWYRQHAIDLALGRRPPMLGGPSIAIPMATQFENSNRGTPQ